MIRYIGKRVLKIIPVLLVVTVISFFVTHLMPGDPVRRSCIKRTDIKYATTVKSG